MVMRIEMDDGAIIELPSGNSMEAVHQAVAVYDFAVYGEGAEGPSGDGVVFG